MTLRDRLYLRFFLYHQRYGRMWAALLEGLCVFVASMVIGLVMFSLFNFAMWVYDSAVQEQVKQEIKQVHAEKVKYERIITACLNGNIIYLDGKARPCSI